MKKVFFAVLVALAATSLNAKTPKTKATPARSKPVFTVVKENKITSIKDQNRSGTCWDYATMSFIESEILRKSGKTWTVPLRPLECTATCRSHKAVVLTTPST